MDCFAGKGKFEDGKPGSPIIALDIIKDCMKNTRMNSVQIGTIFIDLNYADDLHENLKDYPYVNIIS